MFKAIQNWQQGFEHKANLALNHIFIIYAFFLPISVDGYSRSFLFSLILFITLLRGNYLHYFKYAFSHPIVISFFIYAGMHYLWLIGTDNHQWAERMLDQARVAFYPLLFMSFLDKRFALRIISGFLLGMMVSELISYAIHFNLIPWQFIIPDVNYPWKSHAKDVLFYSAHSSIDPSPFLHHSFYTAALALSAAILIYRLLREPFERYLQILSAIFIATMTLNMLIIGGRIGYLLYIILLATLMIILYKKSALKPLFIALSVLIILFTLAYSRNGLFTQRIDQTMSTIQSLYKDSRNFNSSFGMRLGVWYYGADVIAQNPLLGAGTGDQMDQLRNKIPKEHAYLKSMIDMHNHYFQIFMQFGIMGMIILFNLYYQIYAYDTKDEELNGIKTLLLISMLVTAVTATYWHFYLPFYVLLITTVTAGNQTLRSEIKPTSFKLLSTYALLVIISYTMEKLQ